MKSGIISFFNIDEGRFSQVDEFQCMPHFSRYSWGLFRRRTKLLCRKCNNYIGNASQGKAPEYALVTQNSDPTSPRSSSVTKYDIRIRSLQPSSAVALLWALLLLLYIPTDIYIFFKVFDLYLWWSVCYWLGTVLIRLVWLFSCIVKTICLLFLGIFTSSSSSLVFTNFIFK